MRPKRTSPHQQHAGNALEASGHDLVRKAMQYGLDRDPRLKTALFHSMLDPTDRVARQFVQESLAESELRSLIDPDPFRCTAPTEYDNVDGQVVIGQTTNQTVYGINLDALPRHLLNVGATGSGKTQLNLLIASQILTSDTKVRVAALCQKRDYRTLLPLSPDLVVIPWQLLRDNPLRNTPHVDLTRWKNVSVQSFGGLDLRFASKSFLIENVDRLYADFGFTGEKEKRCPRLRDVYDYIKRLKLPPWSHHSRYRESLENRLSGILHHCGEVFDCDAGIDLERLLETNFVIEMDGLAREMRDLLITLLASRIFMYRISRGVRTQHLRTLLIMDEAQNLYRRVAEQQESEAFMGTLIAQAREYGIGVIAGAQTVRDLSFSLTGNTAHKILCGGFVDMRDLDEFCRMV